MKVAILNSYTTGGAARSALRLHRGLLERDMESRFFNIYDSRPAEQIYQLPNRYDSGFRKVFRRFASAVQNRLGLDQKPATNADCELFSNARIPWARSIEKLEWADVVNLHWIADFIDIPIFLKRYAGRKPIVWTLHDMRPFTGGCHYNGNCDKFVTACHNCPMLCMPATNDAAARNFKHYANSLGRLNSEDLTIVCPSEWLAEEAAKSALLSRFPVRVIPYGLETDRFYPVDQHAARAVLAIPKDKSIILFVADSVGNRRKGFDLLLSALEQIAQVRDDIHLLTVGSGDVSKLGKSGLQVSHFGSVRDDQLLRIIYSAADIFVMPSRQDNLPNTMLESLACGTRVVGFGVGGITQVLTNREFGSLAQALDANNLARAIRESLQYQRSGDAPTRSAVAAICKKQFTLSIQAQRYTDLYSEILN